MERQPTEAFEKSLMACWASATVIRDTSNDQSPWKPLEGLIVRPASADRNPVLNEMTTLCTAAGRRLEKVVEEATAAAANAPEHIPMIQELAAFGYDHCWPYVLNEMVTR